MVIEMTNIYRKSYFNYRKENDVLNLAYAVELWNKKNPGHHRVIYWQSPVESRHRRFSNVQLNNILRSDITYEPDAGYHLEQTYRSILQTVRNEYEQAGYLRRKEAFDVLVASHTN